MLRVYSDNYILIGADLAWYQQLFHSIEHRFAIELGIQEDGAEPAIIESAPKELDPSQRKHAKEVLQRLEKTCREVNLTVSAELAKAAAKDLPKTSREFHALIRAVVTELKAQLFLYVPTHLAKYHELMLQESITNAFPKASKEIVSAGNCLTAGLFTACVFHSMRAAEIGVRVLGDTLGVSFPNHPIELAEWQNILDQADSKIIAMKQMPKGTYKDEELAFYSQAAVQFRYFKDAWRVRVAHARESYEENQAIRVFSHTLEFFETLANRLKEPMASV
jgi:hypothetical protein